METNNPDHENAQYEDYLNGLLVRISRLEEEQKLSHDQIQRLAADKKRIKQMLEDFTKEYNNIKTRHAQQENINSTLLIEIQNRALEEKKLRKQVEEIQRQTQQEIQKLREERDAALALIEGRIPVEQPTFYHRYKQLISTVFLILLMILSISIWLLT